MVEASAANDELNTQDKVIIFFVVFLCCGSVAASTWWMGTRPAKRPPSFSVMVTDNGSLDPLLYSPVIHPSFDLTLRVDNCMDTNMCRENATVTVSYGGMVLGWGDLQDICVDKGASKEVMVAISHADVVLTDELRQSMALKLRAGELDVLVELRMLFPKGQECDNCAPQILQHCCVRPGQGYSQCHCHALEIT